MERTRIQKLKLAREAAELVADLLFSTMETVEVPERFWDVLSKRLQEKAGLKLVPVKTMTDTEAQRFEESVVPWGKYGGLFVKHAPLDYWEWYVNDADDFSKQVLSYVTSERFAQRKRDTK